MEDETKMEEQENSMTDAESNVTDGPSASEPEPLEDSNGEEQNEQVEFVPNSDNSSKEDKVQKHAKSLYEYVETFCIALAVLVTLFLFVFRYVSVDGDSMYPTLHGTEATSGHCDRLIISNLFYQPQTGDIVVVNTTASSQPLIKRVIAVGGQTVTINFNTWEVTVDGETLDETYINYIENCSMASGNMQYLYGIDENGICTFTVEEGKVFVMGDNRNNSKDSRFASVGEQPVENILGKVIVRIYPFNEFGTV